MSQLQALLKDMPFPGAVDHEGHVTFTLYAPGKKRVDLVGDFNDWRLGADPMHEAIPGLWTLEKELQRGSFAYQFVLEGQVLICDPYARYVEIDPDGAAKAVVKPREDAYVWRHDDWSKPQYEDLRIYELHIADYTPTRNFNGATKRLDHIAGLGMNAIELMPVFGVKEDAGWGYTPTFLFAPNKDYGTPNELRALIDEAHGKGLAVILDMVLAHTGTEHPFMRMYPYDKSPWYGPGLRNMPNEFGLPQLDYGKEATRFFVKDVMTYWASDYHIDGFRLDYIKVVGSKDGHGLPTFRWATKEMGKSLYLIGEDIPEEPQMFVEAGFDGSWHSRLSYATKALLCEREEYGYDFWEFERCIKALDPADQGYDKKPSMMVNYVESHDEHRLMLELAEAGFDIETARRKSALGATILMTACGVPMLYQGQEWGEDTPKNMDHNFLKWEKLDDAGGKGLVEHYRRLATLRAELPVLRRGNIAIDRTYGREKCAVYHRWEDVGGNVVVAANFSGQEQEVEVPFPADGAYKEFFSGRQADYSGKVKIKLERYSAQVFVKQ